MTLICRAGLLLAMLTTASASELNMIFSNAGTVYDSTNIWISIQRGQAPSDPVTPGNVPDVNYGGTPIVWNTYTNVVGPNTFIGSLFSDPVSLSTINAAGGLTWSGNASSALIYISYGTNLPVSKYSGPGLSPSATTDPSYNIPYTSFEITYTGGAQGDQGDITGINYFTAPIKISSFASTNATGTALQVAGMNTSSSASAALYNKFSQATGGATNTMLVNTNGAFTRVLGPTQFGAGQPNAADFGGYTNLSEYFGSLTNTQTVFSNFSGYNTVANPTTNAAYTNANVVFVLTNQVSQTTNGYAFSAQGEIVTTLSAHAVGGTITNTTIITNTGVIFTVTPDPSKGEIAAAYTYYGDYSPNVGGTNIALGGPGWADFSNNVITGFVNGGGTAAAEIVSAQIAGELASGYSFGFPGSTNTVAQYGTNTLGSLPSGAWWDLTNVIAFSDVQSTNGYYSAYPSIIYSASSNTVYGTPYSDRFKYSSPYIAANSGVGSWLIEIGDPLQVVPEPTFAAAMIVFFLGFAVYKSRVRRRKA